MRNSAIWTVVFGLLVAQSAAAQTAADVVDRETLRAYVERAAEHAESNTDAAGAYEFFTGTFALLGEWRTSGPDGVYVFVVTTDAMVVFHPANPEIEGDDHSELVDENGVRLVVELVEAARAGGDFVEYHVTIDGHPRQGDLKVSYGTLLELAGGDDLVIAAGFHPETVSALPFLDWLLNRP